MFEEKTMNSKLSRMRTWVALGAVFGGMTFLTGQLMTAQTPKTAKTAQEGFKTPKEAADALIVAAERYDVPALQRILGPQSEGLIASKDPVEDKNRATTFAAKAHQKHSVQVDAHNPSRAILSVGDGDWPFPIPLVMRANRWYFDSKTGREEVLLRRIGENELDAITICRGFGEAQKQYAADSPDHEYAQRIISTPGKKDGLYWENPDGSPGGPIAKIVAKAIAEGYSTTKPEPYHGYYFKVLKGQGPAAKLGQLDFVVHGAMIGGFALVAAPAEYRVTGVATFIVSHEGVVYQKDLGPNTLKVFHEMDRYDPNKTWRRTDAEWKPGTTE
jgi:Protein of unknown function (DUF2950)